MILPPAQGQPVRATGSSARCAASMSATASRRASSGLSTASGSVCVMQKDDASVSGSDASEHVAEASARDADGGDGIMTTLEEIEAHQIVRAIACSEVSPSRIAQRDTKSYFGVLLDDNNRKPIARIHFNASQKYIGLFDQQKVETRHPIDALDEIYSFADHIRQTVHFYD